MLSVNFSGADMSCRFDAAGFLQRFGADVHKIHTKCDMGYRISYERTAEDIQYDAFCGFQVKTDA